GWVSMSTFDQASLFQLDAKLNSIRKLLDQGEEHGTIADQVLKAIESVEGPLIHAGWKNNQLVRGNWRKFWKEHKSVATAHFPELVHPDLLNQEAAAAFFAVFVEMVRLAMDANTNYRKQKYADQLSAALRDYLSLRGYDVERPTQSTRKRSTERGEGRA